MRTAGLHRSMPKEDASPATMGGPRWSIHLCSSILRWTPVAKKFGTYNQERENISVTDGRFFGSGEETVSGS